MSYSVAPADWAEKLTIVPNSIEWYSSILQYIKSSLLYTSYCEEINGYASISLKWFIKKRN